MYPPGNVSGGGGGSQWGPPWLLGGRKQGLLRTVEVSWKPMRAEAIWHSTACFLVVFWNLEDGGPSGDITCLVVNAEALGVFVLGWRRRLSAAALPLSLLVITTPHPCALGSLCNLCLSNQTTSSEKCDHFEGSFSEKPLNWGRQEATGFWVGRAYLGYSPPTSEGSAAVLSHQRSLKNNTFLHVNTIKEVGEGQFIAGLRVLKRIQTLGLQGPGSSSGSSTSWPYFSDDLSQLWKPNDIMLERVIPFFKILYTWI